MEEIQITQALSGQRMDKYLKKYFPEAGSSFLYKMMRKKNITLNGKKAAGNELLQTDDKIQIFMKEDTIAKFRGLGTGSLADGNESEGVSLKEQKTTRDNEDKVSHKVQKLIEEGSAAFSTLFGIKVIYEDDHILLVNKPSGILTQKADDRTLSLNEWIVGYLWDKGNGQKDHLHFFRPSICNRLDRNTSGIVICAKSFHGSQEMNRLLKLREMRKFYRLMVEGNLHKDGIIEGFLVKDSKSNLVKIVSKKQDGATPVKTIYRVLNYYAKANATLIEAELVTGKSHQLRAHFSSIGYPIVGDPKYGDQRKNRERKANYAISNQMLHAYRIEFPQMKGEFAYLSNKMFIAPEPAEYQNICRG